MFFFFRKNLTIYFPEANGLKPAIIRRSPDYSGSAAGMAVRRHNKREATKRFLGQTFLELKELRICVRDESSRVELSWVRTCIGPSKINMSVSNLCNSCRTEFNGQHLEIKIVLYSMHDQPGKKRSFTTCWIISWKKTFRSFVQ